MQNNQNKGIKAHIKRFFVAGNHNDFKPHLLTEKVALAFVLFFVLGLAFFQFAGNAIYKNSALLGEVYPVLVATLTNQGRQADNLNTLTYSKTLENAAKAKVTDMIQRSYFAHVGPEGKQPWDWIRENGYEYEYAGENLAINFSDSIDVHAAWMNSPGHRANILNSHYTEVGIAVATTSVNGQESVLVVEMFGSPKMTPNTANKAVFAQTRPQLATATTSNTAQKTLKTTNQGIASTSTSTPVTLAVASTSEVLGLETGPNQAGAAENGGLSVETKSLSTKKIPSKIASATASVSTSTAVSTLGSVTAATSSFAANNTGDVNQVENASESQDRPQNLGVSNTKLVAWSIASNPHMVSLLLYAFFLLLINIVVIGFGFVEYHRHHKKSIFMAVILFTALTVIVMGYIGQDPAVMVI